jgi:hypothetical protein
MINASPVNGSKMILGKGKGEEVIKLLEAANGREVLILKSGSTLFVAFAPDGHLLASTSGPDVLLWDLEQKECINALVVDKYWRGMG